MSKYLAQFKSCGTNVRVADDVYIEHPEVMEVGDHVTFGKGFYMQDQPRECRIGNHVTFMPNCFMQGNGRLILHDHLLFYPNQYFALGEFPQSVIEIQHHSHCAPNCILYGWGGLKLGPYCNIAAHTVFATVGHKHQVIDRPMATTGAQAGPITLEEDVWIGANVTITANVFIAKGCVIGAGAVVTSDTKPMGIYVGVPARRLRDRP